MSGSLPQQAITLDFAREQFYLAQRASERFASKLASFVDSLQQQKEDDAWLEQVKIEAERIVHFHDEQHRQWEAISGSIEAYLASVKQLAETMAVNELKGEQTPEAELPENKAKTVHPELVKFQLEKKARILGKIGGIPALGPGMASVLPQLPKGQILKATASPAAREIYYSKVEHKDAAQLAGVFQFRKKAESDATPVDWQQEQTTQSVRRASEATAAELRRQEEQEQQLVAGGAVGQELANALRMRQRAVSLSEEDQAAAAASSYRRTAPSSSGSADAAKGLQAATPELAQKLKQRQQQAELARRHSESAAEREGAAVGDGRGGVVSADGASSSSSSGPSLGWSNAKAPFGGELASVLLRRCGVSGAKVFGTALHVCSKLAFQHRKWHQVVDACAAKKHC
eukprot:GHUV01015603.1.p1 GENE.GHUV01015603.1~~GHUV01015603.1.p1  ORF type:complete len:402 (+),score=168.86 GHUV01015603.1:387-1592(+)